MGCASSTNQPKKGGKGKKGAKTKKEKKRRESEDSDEDLDPIVLVDVNAKPEQIRKEINKTFKAITDKREKLKGQMRPFLAERRGLNAMLQEERDKLTNLLIQHTALETERETLMNYTWERDADEIFRSYEARDKAATIAIFANRTRWQLDEIGKIYLKKYGEPVYARLVTDGQKLLGKLFTGSQTYLCKLLVYRILPQDERDAAFLRDFTKGMSINDENIMEILLTRSNEELHAALSFHVDEYGSSLREALSNHSYKNYREFIAKVLECNRDERNEPFDDLKAQQLADELYAAGAGRSVGINPDPFIRIFSTINKAQFESINEKYKGKQLLKDIDAKLGGDFAQAIKIRCTDKYVYLASRLQLAMKSSFSTDKDMICRILGCVARWECVKVKEAFDLAQGDKGRGLEASLRNALSSEAHFLRACLALISGDLSQCPMGSDREKGEDEIEVAKAGVRARAVAEENYKRQAVFEKGEAIRNAANAAKKKGAKKDKETSSNNDGVASDPGSGTTSPVVSAAAVALDDDEEIPNFVLDARCKGNDILELTAAAKEAEEVDEQLTRFRETVKDEIIATKESYMAISSHCYETETWIGVLRNHINCLKAFNERRDRATDAKKNWKGGN